MNPDQTVSNTSSDQGLGLHCLLRIIISLRCRKEKKLQFQNMAHSGCDRILQTAYNVYT